MCLKTMTDAGTVCCCDADVVAVVTACCYDAVY